MIAEIFYLSDQENSISQLKDLISTHIYSSTKLILHRIERAPDNRGDSIQTAWHYIKLLQASIAPEKGLKLHVERLEHFGYRFYIKIYHYLNYYFPSISENSFSYLFPAVAIQNHMIIVPQELERLLMKSMDDQPPFMPLELGGLEKVDFKDEATLKAAMMRVGEKLRADLLHEIRAYTLYQKLHDINLPKLIQDIGLDSGFVQQVLKAEAVESVFYQKISCQFDVEKLTLKHWTKVTMDVNNESDKDFLDLVVEILGPVNIRPTRIQINLNAFSTVKIPISIMPENTGEFPLELIFMLPEDKYLAEWLPIKYIWLQCE